MKEDSYGRQFIAMHDVRGALVSANVTLTNGTGGTLIAGDADYLLDIVEITFATASTAGGAVVDLNNDGTVVRSVGLPAGGMHLKFDVPLKQITQNTPWVVDMNDVT